MRRVDQILAGYAEGDAVSGIAVVIRDVLRRMGSSSEIFSDPERTAADRVAAGDWRPLGEYDGGRDDVLIYHYSSESPATDVFLGTRARRILVYHNITPAEWYRGYDDRIAGELAEARSRLPAAAGAADAVWAVSDYNAGELRRMTGVGEVRVWPPPLDTARLDVAPDAAEVEKLAGGLVNFLFVGRLVPNKCVEDLILAFAWYTRAINPHARLVLAGSGKAVPRYTAMLRMLAGELKLENVCFERFVSPSGLAACYRRARVFVTASRHEGYCLPLLEAMYAGVPVIARAAGGMPEAVGSAGILVDDFEAEELAVVMDKAARDGDLRRALLASGKARIAAETGRDLEKELGSLLAPFGVV